MRNNKEQTWLKSLDCYKVTRSESKKSKSKKVKGKGKRRWQKKTLLTLGSQRVQGVKDALLLVA